MRVKFIKETVLHPECKPAKVNQQMVLKSNVAEKLWRKGSVEILDAHDFKPKDEKKSIEKVEKKEKLNNNNNPKLTK